MSLGACIPGLEAEGKLDPRRAAEARKRYDELVNEFVRTGSRETAEALASHQLLDELERQVTRKEFLAGRTVKVRDRITHEIRQYKSEGGLGGRDNGGRIDPRAGPAFLDHDPRAPYSNLEGRRKAVLSSAHRLLASLMADHHTGVTGHVHNEAQLMDVVRELFGEDTGNPVAKMLAANWRQTAEMLRKRFNAAGGDIGFRADWGLPQAHSWRAVRHAGFEEWRQYLLDRLDMTKMTDVETGLPIAPEKLEALLPEIFDNIRSQGAASETPGAVRGAKSLANKRADARFFVFKDAKAWTEYAEKFGHGSAYDAMMGHIEGMARDIAAMEILGPNPQHTFDWLKDTIEQAARTDRDPGTKGIERAKAATHRMDGIWDEYRGANSGARTQWIAHTFSFIRSWQTATKLGSALFSGASDFAYQASTRAFNGLSSKGMLADYIKLMQPGSAEAQKMAVRRGMIAQEWAGRTAAQSRYLLEEHASAFARRLAEGVLRVSLLARHTQSVRWVYGMEALAAYTEAAGKALHELNPGMRGALERYGINAGDWDRLRSAPMDTDGGVEWISPHNLEDTELASRFMEMINEEMTFAVPEADLAARAWINKGLQRGTFKGELGRSALLFKSFGISAMLRQWQRMMTMNMGSAARYAAGLAIGTTLTGGLSNQLHALAMGEDPRPMDDWRFFAAAMQQGGGFGILGDFLYSAESRTEGGIKSFLAGPLAEDGENIKKLIFEDHRRRKLVKTVKGFIPGNNLWFARAALDRMMADQINEMVNPDYRHSYETLRRYAHKQGTEYWWQPGHALPGRAPDLRNAVKKEPAP